MPSSKELYMQRCFQLARKGSKRVKSNPQVGAVLVHDDMIIGEGYHEEFGGPHAEVNCINSVSIQDYHKVSEATLYISLEPCNHQGKTGPCTEVIKSEGIKKVVFAIQDPSEAMSGKSITSLEDTGIEVSTNVCNEDATRLITPFIVNQNYQRPYVILKVAQSADFFMGRVDQSIWLTNQYSKILAHKWRDEVDAIMIGVKTLLVDDPSLTTREYPGENPIPIIIDPHFKSSNTYKVFHAGKRAIIFTKDVHKEDFADIVSINFEIKPEEQILNYLYKQKNICRLLIEGGRHTLKSFVNAKLWNEARVLTATDRKINEGIRSPMISGTLIEKVQLLNDEIHFIRNTHI